MYREQTLGLPRNIRHVAPYLQWKRPGQPARADTPDDKVRGTHFFASVGQAYIISETWGKGYVSLLG